MPENPITETNLQEEINTKLEEIMKLLSVKKVYYIDDSFELNTGKEEFNALILRAINNEKSSELRNITLQGIDFTISDEVLIEHIDTVWENISFPKQLKYFEQVLQILNEDNAVVNDYRKSNTITKFFNSNTLILLKPYEWDEQRDAIYNGLSEGEKIILFIDQDLQHAKAGRYAENTIAGEDIIAEIKQRGNANQSIIILFTHTITNTFDELAKRQEIIQKRQELGVEDFLPLAKLRLEKMPHFADGIKKACLNSRFELIKAKTKELFDAAYKDTSDELSALDTYHFDEVILKSSAKEGVWEAETYLRIFDILFDEHFKKQILTDSYITTVNKEISLAKEISEIQFMVADNAQPNESKFGLRHKEIYEDGELVNKLRFGVNNGDIFNIYEGHNNGDYILVAQECDLMVRNDGTRSGTHGYLFKIEILSNAQLSSEIQNRAKKGEQFFSDKYQLPYFVKDTNKSGIVRLSDTIVVDLNILDMAVFNDEGEITYNVDEAAGFDKNLYNTSWCNRHNLLLELLTEKANGLDSYYEEIAKIDPAFQSVLKRSVNFSLAFKESYGKTENYVNRTFNFGVRRSGRLRSPYSKILLDKYALYLSRNADLHDFAK